MSLFSRLWLGRPAQEVKRRRSLPAPSRCRPLLELLENRVVPAVSVLQTFPGMSFSDTASGEPPDTNVAAGPNHVVELVNTAIRVYDKSGGIRSTQQLASFFSPLAPVGQFSDPQVSYDELTNRFVVGALDFQLPGIGPSRFDFAVSKNSDPTAGWTFNSYDMNDLVGGVADFADFPRLGWNADAYVVSFNMFIGPATFTHVDTLSIDKTTLAGYREVVPGGLTNFTMAPATMHGAAPGAPMWLVEGAGSDPSGDALPGTTIRAVRMDNVLSSGPSFTYYSIPVGLYLNPFLALQPGGLFNTNDSRILNAAWRGNRLVASQTVAGLFTAQARWYDMNVSGVPTLTQSGRINRGFLVSTYFPSIEINAAGDLGLTYMESSYREYVSMYVTGQQFGAAPGTMQPGVLVYAGQGTYLGTRGGDFSGISVDPSNDTFWAANEYSRTSLELWGTWVANFTVSSPPSTTALLGPKPAVQGAGAGTASGSGHLSVSGADAVSGLIGIFPEAGGAVGDFSSLRGSQLLFGASGVDPLRGDPGKGSLASHLDG